MLITDPEDKDHYAEKQTFFFLNARINLLIYLQIVLLKAS